MSKVDAEKSRPKVLRESSNVKEFRYLVWDKILSFVQRAANYEICAMIITGSRNLWITRAKDTVSHIDHGDTLHIGSPQIFLSKQKENRWNVHTWFESSKEMRNSESRLNERSLSGVRNAITSNSVRLDSRVTYGMCARAYTCVYIGAILYRSACPSLGYAEYVSPGLLLLPGW